MVTVRRLVGWALPLGNKLGMMITYDSTFVELDQIG